MVPCKSVRLVRRRTVSHIEDAPPPGSGRAFLASAAPVHLLPPPDPHGDMRMTWRCASLLLGLLPMTLGAQQQATASLSDTEIQPLYSLSQTVRVMAEVCSQQFPQHASTVAAAYAAWGEKHGRASLDSLIERTARRRASMGRAILRSTSSSLLNGDPAAACGNFGAHIATAIHDLGSAGYRRVASRAAPTRVAGVDSTTRAAADRGGSCCQSTTANISAAGRGARRHGRHDAGGAIRAHSGAAHARTAGNDRRHGCHDSRQ